MKVVLTELKDMDGEARLKEIFPRAEAKLVLSDYEKEPYAKSGYIRWQAIVHFYSIDCVKAGYIQKSGGKWYLTEAGLDALKMPTGEFIRSAVEKYRAWKSTRACQTNSDMDASEEETDKAIRQTAYDQAVEQARSEIEHHINGLDPYEFQKLVAELLTGMGYHVPFVASPGKDGGIDLVAYRDPLGINPPRIKVQVKHREQKMTAKEVRELAGILRKEGDIGLIVSSSGFTSDAKGEIQSSSKHIESMDLDRLIGLWQDNYGSISESGRLMLPLVKLFFLAPPED